MTVPRGENKALAILRDKVVTKSADEYNLYCLNDRHIEILMSQTPYIGWSRRWEGEGVTEEECVRFQQEIEGRLQTPMSCGDEKQSRTNITVNNYIRINTYTGVNTSVDPDAPTTNCNWTGTVSENAALCSASEIYVRQTLLNVQNALAVSTGAVAFSAGILGWTLGALGAIVGGAVVLGAGIVVGAVTEAIQDEGAVQSYICKFYNALRGTGATNSAFNTAVNAISTSAGNETTIGNVVKLCSGRLESWLWFLELLGNSKRITASDVDLCNCGLSWGWSYAANACSYGLPPSWTMTVQAGVCGNGAGSFDGIYDYVYPVYRNALVQAVIGVGTSKVKTVSVSALRQAGATSTNYVRVTCGTYLYSYSVPASGIVTFSFTGIDQYAPVVVRGEIGGLGQQNGIVITGITIDYE